MTTFSLTAIGLRPGEEFRDEIPVALEPFALGGERYLPVPGEVPAELTIARATSGDVITLAFTARLHGPCMRCLGDAVVDLRARGREYHDASPGADRDLHCEYVVHDELDLSAWARDLVAEALPDQVLCRPDCAGLCDVCGKNLNVEPHEHAGEVVDPRWADLEQLRDRL